MTRHLAGLDAMRGAAALIVLALHVTTFVDGMAVRAPAHGYLAVDFFFMLSGYVMAHAYTGQLANGLPPLALLRNRAIRLFPMIVLGTGIGMAGALLRHAPPPAILLAGAFSLTTLPMPPLPAVGPGLWPADPPIWSLHWEILASIVFTAGLWRLRLRALAAGAALAAAGIAWAVATRGTLDLGYDADHLFGGPLRVAYAFLAGMVLQRIDAAALGRRLALPVPLLALALLACCIGPRQAPAGYDAVVVLVALPLLVSAAAGAPEPGRVWRFGAVLSYPLYLTHLPVIILMTDGWNIPQHLSRSASLSLIACACLAVAMAALFAWDAPIRRRLARPAQPSIFCGSSTSSPSTSRNQWRVTAEMGSPS